MGGTFCVEGSRRLRFEHNEIPLIDNCSKTGPHYAAGLVHTITRLSYAVKSKKDGVKGREGFEYNHLEVHYAWRDHSHITVPIRFLEFVFPILSNLQFLHP